MFDLIVAPIPHTTANMLNIRFAYFDEHGTPVYIGDCPSLDSFEKVEL